MNIFKIEATLENYPNFTIDETVRLSIVRVRFMLRSDMPNRVVARWYCICFLLHWFFLCRCSSSISVWRPKGRQVLCQIKNKITFSFLSRRLMADRDRGDWDFHLRTLSISARDSNLASDPASDPSLLQSVSFSSNNILNYSLWLWKFFLLISVTWNRWKGYMNCAIRRTLRIWWLGFILRLTGSFNALSLRFLNLSILVDFSCWSVS